MVTVTGGKRDARLAAQKIKEEYQPEAKKFKQAVDGEEPKPKRAYTRKTKEDPAPEYEIEEDKEPLTEEEVEAISEVLKEEIVEEIKEELKEED